MEIGREVEELNVHELIGELFMPRLEIADYTSDPEYRERIQKLAQEHRVGGFCIFGGDPASIISTIGELQRIAIEAHQIPLLFSADFEFGLPMRLASGGTEFPDAMALGRCSDLDLTRAVAKAIGEEAKALGIGWNFAPVADVNSNRLNPIINIRSFGETPDLVSEHVTAMIQGMRDAGIASSAKHFPGHGDTNVDSHRSLPVIQSTREEMDLVELPPFFAAIRCGVSSIMIGHIALPNLAESLGATEAEMELPASLSKPIITGLLRDQLHFNGVVVTDGLEMQSITNAFGVGEACLMAFIAGSDVLLLPSHNDTGFQRLMEALEAGLIAIDQLRVIVRRIFALKHAIAVPTNPNILVAETIIGCREHQALSLNVAKRALSIEGDLKKGLTKAKAMIFSDPRPKTRAKAEQLREKLLSLNIVESCSLTVSGQQNDMPEEWRDKVIIALHRGRGFIGLTEPMGSVPAWLTTLASTLSSHGERCRGLILFGNPYLDDKFKEHSTSTGDFVIKAYSESDASIEAVIERMIEAKKV
jgi:beta-N-acetylhexosaminidase